MVVKVCLKQLSVLPVVPMCKVGNGNAGFVLPQGLIEQRVVRLQNSNPKAQISHFPLFRHQLLHDLILSHHLLSC